MSSTGMVITFTATAALILGEGGPLLADAPMISSFSIVAAKGT